MIDSDTLWSRIQQHSGEIFRQIRGGEFTYIVKGDYVIPDRTKVQIPKKHFAEAIKLLPLPNTVPLQNFRGPSYIYAILMDKRILEG